MVGWQYRLDGHKFEQALGVGEGQRSLACCRPWGHKGLDMTERLNNKSSCNFGMLSRFVIALLPRSKHLLISRLQSPSARRRRF